MQTPKAASSIPPGQNGFLSELLARESEVAKPPIQRALRRAARMALVWPEEAADLVAQGRSLTELPSIGPYLEKLLRRWLDDPPPTPKPPELRSDFLSLAFANRLMATEPEWKSRLKGDLQMHSTWSDGSGTIAQMSEAAVQQGYEFISITDHAQGLKIAGGINPEQLAVQSEEIESVNGRLSQAKKNLRVLRSIELNLTPEGEGDLPAATLDRLDIVLGSFHSALRRTDDQTDRYLAALRNPTVQILGHPRGRVFNYRLGLKADWPAVFAEAARLDKAVEIDSYADRQDISVELLVLARRAGCRISIGTDAHHPWQLGFASLGLAHAFLARIKPERIINFMNAEQLKSWVNSVRANAVGPVRKPLRPSVGLVRKRSNPTSRQPRSVQRLKAGREP